MTRSLFDLTGRSALVTGIGAAVASALAAAGAAVLVGDVDADAASPVAERICASGGKAEGIAIDVRDGAGDVRRPHRRKLPSGTRHPFDGGGALRPGRADVPADRWHRTHHQRRVATRMTETIRTHEKFAANMMNRIPLKRWAVFLASNAASYITGQLLPVDGGMVM